MIDVIGEIYEQGEYDEQGNVIKEPTQKEGYFVNVIEVTPDLEPFVIHPATPTRVFAGAETYCLRFADRDEWLALGYETQDDDGEWQINDQALITEYQKQNARKTMVVGPYQIRKTLRDAGLLDAVKAFVDQADVEIQEAWQHSTEFKRLDPMILAALDSLGIDEDTADQLFECAKSI
jgi:hypothetical protein